MEHGPPIGLEAPWAALDLGEAPLEVSLEAFGLEVEADSDEGEEAKGDYLHGDAGQGDVLARLPLAGSVDIGSLRARNHYGTDDLQNES